MLPAPRRTLLSAGVLTAALALSGCTGSDSATSPELKPGVAQAPIASSAPKPAATLAAPVQELVTGTDVGEFLVTPNAELGKAQVAGAVARLKTLAGVDAAELTPEGKVDLVFTADVTRAQREAAVKQLAALGTVEEGI